MRTIDNMIADADKLIDARLATSQEKTAAAAEVDPVEKMAEELRQRAESQQKQAAEEVPEASALGTIIEKLAHESYLKFTMRNADVLRKMDDLEKQAAAKGHSPERIGAFFEKNAAAFKLDTSDIDWLGSLAAG